MACYPVKNLKTGETMELFMPLAEYEQWRKDNVRIYILDADGSKLDSETFNSDRVGFVLSDDMPFTDEEKEIFEGIERVSLGDTWLQGHACISIIHHQLDFIR